MTQIDCYEALNCGVYVPQGWRVGVLIWGVCTLLMVATSGCGDDRSSRSSPVATDTTTGPVPEQVSWDPVFTLMEDGDQRAILRAPRMEQYETEDSTYALLDGTPGRVHAQVFDAAGDSSATITANRVLYFDRQGRFEAFDSVVVVTPEGKRLTTEHLTWSQGDRSLRTRRFVRIVTPSEVVQGNGLVADEDLDTYRIGRFTARVAPDEETDD